MKKAKKLLSVILSLIIVFSTVLFNTVTAQALSKVSVEEGTYVFYSKLDDNMVMDINDASAESGANVQLWEYNGSTAQQFQVKKSGDWYTIQPVCSNLALDVKGGSAESGANVQQYKVNNSDAQKWQFYDNGNGYYYIRSKSGDKALDVNGGKKTKGTNIQVYTPIRDHDPQLWKLKKVSTSTKHTMSQEGIKFLKKWEGFRSTAYIAKSGEKYYTIGYGHYGSDVKKGQTITQQQAEDLLKKDLKKYEKYINNFLSEKKISVSQNQFDALVSFTYNLGNVWKTKDFSLKRYLQNGVDNYTDAQIRKAFTNWNKSGGKPLEGLTNRRNAEADLFLQ